MRSDSFLVWVWAFARLLDSNKRVTNLRLVVITPVPDTVREILSKVIEIPRINLRIETAFPKAASIVYLYALHSFG